MGAAQESPYYEAKSSTRLNKVDPYHPPGFSIHLRRTIVWEILPEVTFFTLVATGEHVLHPLLRVVSPDIFRSRLRR